MRFQLANVGSLRLNFFSLSSPERCQSVDGRIAAIDTLTDTLRRHGAWKQQVSGELANLQGENSSMRNPLFSRLSGRRVGSELLF